MTRAFVGDFEYDRLLLEKDGKTFLYIKLGPNYVKALQLILKEVQDKIAFYYFARIFEASDLAGESGIHKHIISLQFLEPFPYETEGRSITVTPTVARLDFDGEAYNRLRRTGRLRGASPFPPYEEVGT